MKAYTDLSQSKKLAEFLPYGSADMVWISIEDDESFEGAYEALPKRCSLVAIDDSTTPCWSLAALLSVLPKIINNETLFIETSSVLWHIGYRNVYIARADNPVDACVAMILKLKERNLL